MLPSEIQWSRSTKCSRRRNTHLHSTAGFSLGDILFDQDMKMQIQTLTLDEQTHKHWSQVGTSMHRSTEDEVQAHAQNSRENTRKEAARMRVCRESSTFKTFIWSIYRQYSQLNRREENWFLLRYNWRNSMAALHFNNDYSNTHNSFTKLTMYILILLTDRS